MEIVDGVLKSISKEDIVDGHITLSDDIVEIAPYVFYGLQDIVSIDIPSSVKKIGASAFQMSTIESINIPDSVEVIEEYAFSDCNKLKTVELSKNLSYLGNHAFSQSGIKKIEIPSSLKVIEAATFSKCYDLQDISIKNGVEIISEDAFYSCKSLWGVVIPNSVKNIGERAFLHCEKLAMVNMSNNLEVLGRAAFMNCQSLESIDLPGSLKVIPKEAFKDCKSLSELHIENGVLSIEESAFSYCSVLSSVELPNSITELGKETFYYCEKLRRIKLPEGISSIPDRCFDCCQLLNNVVIPSGVQVINRGAFNNCENLTNLEFNEGLKSIGRRAFAGVGVRDLKFPESLEEIGEFAFEYCYNIKNVKLPKNLARLGRDAFRFNTSLTSIEIPGSITNIKSDTFYNCSNLTRVIINEGIKTIGEGAFGHSEYLSKIVLPSTLETIGDRAFERTALKSIELPQSLKSIGKEVFENSELVKLKIPGGVKEIGELALSQAQKLKEVNIDEGVEVIGDGAFFCCPQLKKVNIPSSVKQIKKNAFYKTSLKNVKLPPKLETVDYHAFEESKDLKKITLYSDTRFDQTSLMNKINFTLINRETGESIQIKDLVPHKELINASEGILIHKDSKYMFFDYDNKWVDISEEKFNKVNKNGAISNEHYKKLYEWMKKGRFIPHHTIIENMPVNEIDNFYINSKKWKELLIDSKIELDEEKGAFFKLCYSMGLFSKKGSTSDRAYNFIKEVLKKYPNNEYHIRFGGLDTYKRGYIEEFAELMFKYYLENDDMFVKERVWYEDIDYTSAIYNNFDVIQRAYPNKVVNTTTINEMLTPQMCVYVIGAATYEGVKVGNDEFAANIGRYGYSQEDFNRAQELFEIGKNIPQNEITLHASKDDESHLVTYELLEKDDPLGVILGDITNCCQTLTGVGKSCVEYGLSQRNSKFMIFKNNQTIIGQSWVWYDETTKRICLDNIEVPSKLLKKLSSDKKLQEEFIKCLLRVSKGFVKEMNEKGLSVSSVTIGAGYNDVKYILEKSFKLIVNQPNLSNYSGYSDATKQYVLYEEGNTIHKKL